MYKEKCLIPSVKHGGGNIIVWDCMRSNDTNKLCFINRIMSAEDYIKIFKENILPSLKCLESIFQHDNDPKHFTKKSTVFFKN